MGAKPYLVSLTTFGPRKFLRTPRDELTFPVAALGNYHAISPEWRPHVFASLVHVLHGTKTSDPGVFADYDPRLKSDIASRWGTRQQPPAHVDAGVAYSAS